MHKKNYSIGFVLFMLVCGISYKIVNDSNNKNKITVDLAKCIDGDTARFLLEDDKEIKARFLYIDTPESTNEIEAYGKEAAEYTCNALSNAESIRIQYNPSGDQKDKYDRELVWVFVDGELLQELLAINGFVEDYYDYNVKYLYKDRVIWANELAKKNKVGLYSE